MENELDKYDVNEMNWTESFLGCLKTPHQMSNTQNAKKWFLLLKKLQCFKPAKIRILLEQMNVSIRKSFIKNYPFFFLQPWIFSEIFVFLS